jgi:hypothetical protein
MADHMAHLERVAPGASTDLDASAPAAAEPSTPGSGASEPSGTAVDPSASAPAASEPSAPASTSGGPADTSTAAPQTRSRRTTLTGLADAESQAVAERTSACDSAQSPALARDLCLIAASEAQHAQVLLDLRAGLAG